MTKGVFARKTWQECFWEKVKIGEPDECWPWQASVDSAGYGNFSFEGRTWKAHRLAFTLKNGEIPAGHDLMHSCDNRACCNWKNHLKPGTHKENMADMVAKNRQARGDTHGFRLHPDTVARGERSGNKTHPEAFPRGESKPFAKLTEVQVREIRQLFDTGKHSMRELARTYGVSHPVISGIVRRVYWNHI